MGIPTLIKTLTADNDSSLDFVDGTASVVLDSTYDEYMFVCTDIGQVSNGEHFAFQVNKAGDSGFDKAMTTSAWVAQHSEAGEDAQVAISTSLDQAQGTSYQAMAMSIGSESDESAAGILHLFSPASTTYVTHFYSRFSSYHGSNYAIDFYSAGYINITEAVDEISFKMTSGNFDGVIQMYGIS